jgi:hypothetical protein
MIYLPDTNILIGVITNRKDYAALLERLLAERHLLATCAVIVGEVYNGMRPVEEARTHALMESMEFLPATYEIARVGGILRRDFTRKGKTLSLADTAIAALAMAYKCTLITENVKDFPIPELRLLAP